jgi:glyoxylase I family protein
MASITGIAHVELSVRDLDRSEHWYTRLLEMQRVFEGRDAERGLVSRALYEPRSKFVLGLMQHDANTGETFAPQRTGLDHLSFYVTDRDELRAWERRLDELGIDYSPLHEEPYGGAAVTATDPDGIALEFCTRDTPRG